MSNDFEPLPTPEVRQPGSLHPHCSTADRAGWLVGEWRRQATSNREMAVKWLNRADQLDACATDLEGRIDKLEKRKP